MQKKTVTLKNLPSIKGIVGKIMNNGPVLVTEGHSDEFGSQRKIKGDFHSRKNHKPVCEVVGNCNKNKPGLLLNVGEDDAEIPVGSKVFLKGNTIVFQTLSEDRRYFIALRRS